MTATLDPARTAALAARTRLARQAAALVADPGWCPTVPPAERIARRMLADTHPDLRYDLVGEHAARAALARSVPGHSLPDVLEHRARQITAETDRVHAVLGYVAGVLDRALAEVEAPP